MLPDTLLQNLHAVHDAAEVWLARLPETLAGLEARWQLRVTSLAPGLSFNLVTYAERTDGTRCVLKLSPPFEEAVGEAEALSYYAGDGICRILERDNAVSALLLGRITPGLPLQKVWTPGVDEIHTRVTAELMQRLWRKVAEPHPLRSLQSWARALSEDRGPSVPTPF